MNVVTVKIKGPGTDVIGDLIAEALKEHGIKITHWNDVLPKDREPHAVARREKATVLILEMR